jgi:uncharacterized phiE125 gp8 family phage protein
MSDNTPEIAINIDYAKQFLKISHDHEDELLHRLILIATKKLEDFSGLAIIKREFIGKFYAKTLAQNSQSQLKLPHRPINFVSKIEAFQQNGEKNIIPANLYSVSSENTINCHFIPNYSYIEVHYNAGTAEKPEQIDATVQHALLEIIAHLYEYRGSTPSLEEILDRYHNLRNFKL